MGNGFVFFLFGESAHTRDTPHPAPKIFPTAASSPGGEGVREVRVNVREREGEGECERGCV